MFKMFSVVCLCAGFLSGVVARADTAYNYSYSGGTVSGSGVVTLAAADPNGAYGVTSITGNVNGTAINTLLPTGTYKGNDNLFFNSTAYLDGNGVSFSLVDGSNVNVFYDGSDYYFEGDTTFQLDHGTAPMTNRMRFAAAMASGDPAIKLDGFNFSPADVAPTPEPSSLLLLGTGVLGVAGAVRRRVTGR